MLLSFSATRLFLLFFAATVAVLSFQRGKIRDQHKPSSLSATFSGTSRPQRMKRMAIGSSYLSTLSLYLPSSFGRERRTSSRRIVPHSLRGRDSSDPEGDFSETIESRIYREWRRLPLQPYQLRETTVDEVVPGQVFSLEQQLGVFDVVVNIRMTVLVVEGGLAVVNPIAPTKECVEILHKLEKKYGGIKYILLPTTQVEHKIYLEPLSRQFPSAQVWGVGRQWSFPPFPLSLIGYYPSKISGILRDTTSSEEEFPFQQDLEIKLLDIALPGSIPTPFQEAAIYHKRSKSLIVTDAVVSIPKEPPRIVSSSPSSLLKISGVWSSPSASSSPKTMFLNEVEAADSPQNTAQNRREGWAKTVLLACFLSPSSVSKELREFLDEGFVWSSGWEKTFQALISPSLIVSPLVSELVFRPQSQQVRSWAENVAEWPFRRVIPAHFGIAQRSGPKEFLRAFAFLNDESDASYKSTAGSTLSIPGTLKEDYSILQIIANAAFGKKSGA
mmetsp:Transcript_17071/g.27744  ORF Transcript_17071/g.27744 Transcript_17071/m.27744 type:complete len:500 (+) Transcript_17071:127-1626(+)